METLVLETKVFVVVLAILVLAITIIAICDKNTKVLKKSAEPVQQPQRLDINSFLLTERWAEGIQKRKTIHSRRPPSAPLQNRHTPAEDNMTTHIVTSATIADFGDYRGSSNHSSSSVFDSGASSSSDGGCGAC